MCFIWLADRVHPERPVLVAANRDEAWARPSAAPRVFPGTETDAGRRGPDILAPVDLVSGGTWIGWNGDGVLAAVTERPSGTPDPTLPSRGLVTLRALGAASAAEAVSRVRACVEGQPTNPFQLVAADGTETHVIVYDGPDELDVHELPPGLHVLTNRGDPDTVLFDEVASRHPATAILGALAAPAGSARFAGNGPEDRSAMRDESLLERMSQVVTDRSSRDGEGRSIVKASTERGTVSSTLVVGGGPDRSVRFRFADDAPWPHHFRSFDEPANGLRGSIRRRGATDITPGGP